MNIVPPAQASRWEDIPLGIQSYCLAYEQMREHEEHEELKAKCQR